MGTSKSVLRRIKIKHSIRKKINGTEQLPRLTVFRSNKEIYAQVVNDDNGLSIASIGSQKLSKDGKTKTQVAVEVGKAIADAAKLKGVSSVVFDRNGYLFHGRVKALADAARENGLNF